MNVLGYSLRFIKLSKCAPCLVSDPRDEMIHFVWGVPNDLKNECYSALINDNMNTSRFMFHAQKVEEARVKRKHRDANRPRSLMVVL